jgi:hypothetical protein
MHMRHNLTTVPLARVGTEEVGGWLFFAVCESIESRLTGLSLASVDSAASRAI